MKSNLAYTRPDAAQFLFNTSVREELYLLLANLLFAPPGDETRQFLAQTQWPSGSFPQLGAVFQNLTAAATDFSARDIQEEFNCLFVGMGRGEVVPYASWYREKLLMGKPLAFLREDLSQSGICRREAVSEPEDHAAALLEAMVLILRDPNAPRPQQVRFFKKHIQPWMIRFFNDLASASAARFYRPVGVLGSSFLQIEAFEMSAETERRR